MASMRKDKSRGQLIASMTNHTPKELICDRYYNWSGSCSQFPPTIPTCGSTKFTQLGFKGAIVYNGLNKMHNPTSWLLAWDVPKFTSGGRNKVYVLCGSKCIIDKMTEEQILKKLNEASDESSAIDQVTKSVVKANIRTPNEPVDVAIFASFRVVV